MKEITLKDIFDFVQTNKGSKTFRDYTDLEILVLLKQGVESETLFYKTNEKDEVVGMVLAELRPELGVLFVTENLAINKETLREFAKMAQKRYGNYRLEWWKNGIYKRHDTERFYKKLFGV